MQTVSFLTNISHIGLTKFILKPKMYLIIRLNDDHFIEDVWKYNFESFEMGSDKVM